MSGNAVRHWITGERGAGNFPRPVIHRGERVRLYSWAEVSRWLAETGHGEVGPGVAETAAAAAEVDALLRAREILRAAPSAYPAHSDDMAKLVDA
jgi:hypothetical protein